MIAVPTTTTPQDIHMGDRGLPEIEEVTFTVDGFDTPSPSTARPIPLISQPAAQKMTVAKKVTAELAHFFKRWCVKGKTQ